MSTYKYVSSNLGFNIETICFGNSLKSYVDELQSIMDQLITNARKGDKILTVYKGKADNRALINSSITSSMDHKYYDVED